MGQLEVGAARREGGPPADGRRERVSELRPAPPSSSATWSDQASTCRRRLWRPMEPRHPRVDRDGRGRDLPWLTFAELARLAPATGGPYAYTRMALWRFRRLSDRLGLLDLDLGVAAGDRRRLCRRRHRPVPGSAAIGRWPSALTLGAIWARGARQPARRQRPPASSQRSRPTRSWCPSPAIIALSGCSFIDMSHFSEFNPSGQSLLESAAALAR